MIESKYDINLEMGPKYKTSIGYHLIKREYANKDSSMGAGMEEEEANDD